MKKISLAPEMEIIDIKANQQQLLAPDFGGFNIFKGVPRL